MDFSERLWILFLLMRTGPCFCFVVVVVVVVSSEPDLGVGNN